MDLLQSSLLLKDAYKQNIMNLELVISEIKLQFWR